MTDPVTIMHREDIALRTGFTMMSDDELIEDCERDGNEFYSEYDDESVSEYTISVSKSQRRIS